MEEKVVGGDETTENINGKVNWLWAWRSDSLTYLAGGKGRGTKDFNSEYPDGFPNSIFVSDRLPLYYNVVPFDNNGSEREIRKAKTKMKVSQCFRSLKGAEAFDVLHSLMDTAKKNGQSAFNVIKTIAHPKAIADTVCPKF